MRQLLAIDPGAEKCGWAILEPGPKLIDSGVQKWPRGSNEAYQAYRLRVEHDALWFFDAILASQHIGRVVNEIVPPAGFNNSSQSYLANCVASALHCAGFSRGCSVSQISARTVQSRVAKKKSGNHITKAQVRNGVIEIMPEVGKALTQHLMEWDRWDAIALGLTSLGHKL